MSGVEQNQFLQVARQGLIRMKNVTMVTGLVLVLIGVAGYWSGGQAVPEAADGETIEKARSWTALIPAIFGVPVFLCGLIAAIKPDTTKLVMHIAVTAGLLGALAATAQGFRSLMKLMSGDGDFNQRAFVFLALMAIACWIFVVLCVRSFIKARQAGKTKEQKSDQPAAGT